MSNRHWRGWVLLFFGSIALWCCSAKDTKYDQYYAQGQVLYEKNCSNCHQKNGSGLGLVYPPLAESDYFDNNQNESFCQMKYGKKGVVIVNGKSFNKAMPGVPSLTELEIAEIATYLNNSWGRKKGIVEIRQVKLALANCGPH
jgi:mono/diheme cytochrome c family protein